MDYLLKSTICLTAFYGLYFFGFRRLSFHTLNRFYLLVSLALSLTIPLLNYERTEVITLEPQPIEKVSISSEEIQEITYNQAPTIPQTITLETVPDTAIDWLLILNVIYLVGVGVMVFLFLKNLLTIFFAIKKASASMVSPPASLNHRKLKILMAEKYSNSSFFNYVFLNPDKLNPHEEGLIIAHEGFHAQRLHTLDLLFLGILKAIFWFNPIIYFYQKSLKQIHEYEVDALMSATHDGREYAHLLLKLSVAPNAMIINQFSTKPLSERIQFLFKTPTKNMKKLLYFLSLPLITVGIMAFAEEKVITVYQEKTTKKPILKKEQKTNLQSMIPVDTTTKKKIISTDIFTHKIDFNLNLNLENIDSLKLSINNKYLVEGKDYILQGNEIYLDQKYSKSKTRITMYSSKVTGNYGRYKGSNIFTEFTKLELSPYTKLNRVNNQPIFEVKNSKDFFLKQPSIFYKTTKSEDTLRTIFETNKLGKNPLVIINRMEYPSSILYRINPEAIDSQDISSQKDKNTVLFFGEKAKDGCIEIITKKGVDIFLKNDENRKSILENVAKQVQESKKRIKREIVKNKNGEEYEKISVMRLDGETVHFSSGIPIGKKTVFIVDGKKVTEEEVEDGKQVFVKGGCGIVNKQFLDIYGESFKEYHSYFILDTKH